MNHIINYENYLEKILYIIDNYSGSHSINKKLAKEWISLQPTEESKIAAKCIIKHTKYITYKNIFNYIEKLVKVEYKKISKSNKKIYMYIGQTDDSNYFISILALYWIKYYGYREPDKYFNELPYHENISNEIYLIYFDDMAFSGGQIMSNILNIICDKIIKYINNKYNYTITISKNTTNKLFDLKNNLIVFYKTKKEIDIKEIQENMYKYILNIKYYNIIYYLLGINKYSYNKIINDKKPMNKYIIDIFDKIENINHFELNYEIKYYKMYPTIDDLCSTKEYFYMSYFFSFGRSPFVLIYYDHKISDLGSTFLKALNFGPIVPNNFDISHYWSPFKNIITEEGLYEALNINYKEKESLNYILYMNLCHKYYKNVINNNYENINIPIKFYPFINNCYNIENVINHQLMKNINYLELISNFPKLLYIPKPTNVLDKHFQIVKNCIQPFISITDLLYLRLGNNYKLLTKCFYFLKDIIYYERCNLSFYKSKDYTFPNNKTKNKIYSYTKKNKTHKK
jgi:hypothetical protein